MDIIRLKNMQFYGFHGVSESEKHLGGRFEVDLEMQLPLKKSCDSDDLNDTVDYEKIYKIVDLCIKKDKFYAKNHGSIRNVLIENYNDGFLSGFSENYVKVKTKGQVESVNTIIPLQLNYSSDGIMLGKQI